MVCIRWSKSYPTPAMAHQCIFMRERDEHIAILEAARFANGDRVFDGHAGEVVTLRKGIPHAWGNRSNTPLRVAFLVSPGGVEEVLELIAKGATDIPALAERFHVRIVGPAPF